MILLKTAIKYGRITPESSIFFMPIYCWLDRPELLLQIYFPGSENNFQVINEEFVISELPFVAFYLELFFEGNTALQTYLQDQYQSYYDEYSQTEEGSIYLSYFDLL